MIPIRKQAMVWAAQNASQSEEKDAEFGDYMAKYWPDWAGDPEPEEFAQMYRAWSNPLNETAGGF